MGISSSPPFFRQDPDWLAISPHPHFSDRTGTGCPRLNYLPKVNSLHISHISLKENSFSLLQTKQTKKHHPFCPPNQKCDKSKANENQIQSRGLHQTMEKLTQTRGILTEPRVALCIMLTAWWAHPMLLPHSTRSQSHEAGHSVARFTAEEQRGIKLRGQHHAATKDRSWDSRPGSLTSGSLSFFEI